jgi:hypothetical protein
MTGRPWRRLRDFAAAALAIAAQATLQSLASAELDARWHGRWRPAVDGAALAAGLVLGAAALWRWRRGRGLPRLSLEGTAALVVVGLLTAHSLWSTRAARRDAPDPRPLAALLDGDTCGRAADTLESQA